MALNPQLTAAAQKGLGLPEGFKTYSPFPFAGMNAQSSGIAIADHEFVYAENFLRLGDGYLRTAWDIGVSIYNTDPTRGGKTIVSFFFFNIGGFLYAAVFHRDGTAVQVQIGSGAQTTIGSGFYQQGGALPACSQWGTIYLLISNNNTPNDYWIWDGARLFTSGSMAPTGANLISGGAGYTSIPTVQAIGGSGFGIALAADINAGSVSFVGIQTVGQNYQVGDVVQLFFTGGGSDNSAFMVANLTPTTVGGAFLTKGGSGYSTASANISGGGGTGATASVTIGTGVKALLLTNGGEDYSYATVTIAGGGGVGATAEAVVANGSLTLIPVTSPGSGYTSAPAVTIAGDGTGAAATALIQGGVITGIQITAVGSAYTSPPSIAITGDGSGATAQALLFPTSVASVTITATGTGFFTVPLISFVGGGGAGATGLVNLVGTTVANIDVTAGGQNYAAAPSVIFNPASYGITATANIDGGRVVSVTVTNAGTAITGPVQVLFQPAMSDPGTGAGAIVELVPTVVDTVTLSSAGQGYTSVPSIIITPGANNAAYGNVSLMPYGVSGSSIETFLSRVWLADQGLSDLGLPTSGNFLLSAPESLIDFSTSDGGLQFSSTDSFLQTKYTGIRQSNGYLYFFGDGSISVVSNVNTAGSPSTTTFNYQNVDPQTGLSWRDTRQDFGRSILFMNETGVYGLYGGAVTKVSTKLDQLFTDALFSPRPGSISEPSSAIATLFNVKHYLGLMTIVDPDTSAARNVMVTWNEKDWVITSQSVGLTYIGSQKVESKFQAWGTDGHSLYPLFAKPSALLTKRLDLKVYGAESMFIMKDMLGFWMQAQDRSAERAGIQASVSFAMSGLAIQNPQSPSIPSGVYSGVLIQEPELPAAPPFWPLWGTGTVGMPFLSIGARITTTSPDFAIGNLVLGYKHTGAFYSG